MNKDKKKWLIYNIITSRKPKQQSFVANTKTTHSCFTISMSWPEH